MNHTTTTLISCLVLGAVACATPIEDDTASADPGGGLAHRVDGSRLLDTRLDTAEIDTAAVLAAARRGLRDELGNVEAAQLRPVSRARSGLGGIAALEHVRFEQAIEGVPIDGTHLYITLSRRASAPKLLAASYRVYRAPAVDVRATIADRQAVEIARAALRASEAHVRTLALTVVELDGRLQLCWDVALAGFHHRVLVHANGPAAGRALVRDARVHQTNGEVRGLIATGAPGASPPTWVPLAALDVIAGDRATRTDAAGRFSLDAAPGNAIEARLAGAAAVVVDALGRDLEAAAPVEAAVSLMLGDERERALAQVTAYHEVTRMRRFLAEANVDVEAFSAPLAVEVNVPETCNAAYSPLERRMLLFQSGDGCHNSAERSIIAHEYGHFVDDAFGGIDDGGLSEGWGDALACLSSGDPEVGAHLFESGGPLRRCDNDYRFPPGGLDEVHALGQAWAGFVWHVRDGLIARHGQVEGNALTRELVLPSLASSAPDIPTAVREVFLRDDDDGDLATLTPHWSILFAAADRHGLSWVVDRDVTAPSAIEDLRLEPISPTALRATWTAPGDDGGAGTAARYELRYAHAPLDAARFATASAASAPSPLPAGTAQQATIPAIPGQPIYVAIRAIDDAGNAGPLSPVVNATPPNAPTLLHTGAEDGAPDWNATGLWHVTDRYAASGTRAFWYGREQTGDYDTGGRTLGALTSPIIDLTDATAPALVFAERADVEDRPDYDRLEVVIADVDRELPPVRVAKRPAADLAAFSLRIVDLSPLAGRRVRVQFRFDSVDAGENHTLGWLVDDIRIIDAAPPPTVPALLINEILADPPSGFDAEFVELANLSSAPIDLSGHHLADAVRTRYVFPDGTLLAPGEVHVVDGDLYLNNDGDRVAVHHPDGTLLAEVTFGPIADQSWVRATDLDPDAPLVPHKSLSANAASPGLRTDGTGF